MPAIKPDEVVQARTELPNAVFDVFNDLIVEKFNGNYARVLQKDVEERLVDRGFVKSELYSHHWMDVEDAYKQAGWSVIHDQPIWRATYDAYYEFSVHD